MGGMLAVSSARAAATTSVAMTTTVRGQPLSRAGRLTRLHLRHGQRWVSLGFDSVPLFLLVSLVQVHLVNRAAAALQTSARFVTVHTEHSRPTLEVAVVVGHGRVQTSVLSALAGKEKSTIVRMIDYSGRDEDRTFAAEVELAGSRVIDPKGRSRVAID